MNNAYMNMKSTTNANLFKDSEALNKNSRPFIAGLISYSYVDYEIY